MHDSQKTTDFYIEQLKPTLLDMFKYEGSGHDFGHLERVYRLAMHIQKTEGGDPVVIGVAAYLHDLHRLKEKQTGIFCHPRDSLSEVKQILESVNFDVDKIEKVLHCIEFHEEYSFSPGGITVTDIETLILQDADNLDAIGAIGLARTFAYHGSKGDPIFNPDIPLQKDNYVEGIKDPDAIHHYYSKLSKLDANMNTNTAKQLAKGRQVTMENFVNRFLEEFKGQR